MDSAVRYTPKNVTRSVANLFAALFNSIGQLWRNWWQRVFPKRQRHNWAWTTFPDCWYQREWSSWQSNTVSAIWGFFARETMQLKEISDCGINSKPWNGRKNTLGLLVETLSKSQLEVRVLELFPQTFYPCRHTHVVISKFDCFQCSIRNVQAKNRSWRKLFLSLGYHKNGRHSRLLHGQSLQAWLERTGRRILLNLGEAPRYGRLFEVDPSKQVSSFLTTHNKLLDLAPTWSVARCSTTRRDFR